MPESIHDKTLVLATYYFTCHFQNLVLPASSKYMIDISEGLENDNMDNINASYTVDLI
jgi:hypothetical protein